MTNLYELLGQILAKYDRPDTGFNPSNTAPGQLVHITPDMADFIRNYMRAPDVLINFKARKTGQDERGEPVMAQDFQIAGDPFEVFVLLCEAMVQNFRFAEMVERALAFYQDHIPTCPVCLPKYMGVIPADQTWNFSHPQFDKNGPKQDAATGGESGSGTGGQ